MLVRHCCRGRRVHLGLSMEKLTKSVRGWRMERDSEEGVGKRDILLLEYVKWCMRNEEISRNAMERELKLNGGRKGEINGESNEVGVNFTFTAQMLLKDCEYQSFGFWGSKLFLLA